MPLIGDSGQIERVIKNAQIKATNEIDAGTRAVEQQTDAQKKLLGVVGQTGAIEARRREVDRLTASYDRLVQASGRARDAQGRFVPRGGNGAGGDPFAATARNRFAEYQNLMQQSPAYKQAEQMRKLAEGAHKRFADTPMKRLLDDNLKRYTPRLPSLGGRSVGGGVGPLLERLGLGGEAAAGAEGLAAAGPVVGGLVFVGKVAYEAGHRMLEAAKASAEMTQRFTDLRTQIGGTSRDAGRAAILSRITGVEAGSAARSFNDRITSDPMAMALAARFGVYNTPGIYGRRNFGAQYQRAIESVSGIRDADARERTAQALGIEQEVSRTRLLSRGTRGRLNRTGFVSALVNNPEAERRAAELQAAVQNEEQARANLQNAFGQGFAGGATKFLNALADVENGGAIGLIRLNAFADRFRFGPDKQYAQRSARAIEEVKAAQKRAGQMGAFQDAFASGGSGSGSSSSGFATASAGGTQGASFVLFGLLVNELKELNGNLAKFNGTYGGGDNAQSAIPSALRNNPIAAAQAVNLRALHLGPLAGGG